MTGSSGHLELCGLELGAGAGALEPLQGKWWQLRLETSIVQREKRTSVSVAPHQPLSHTCGRPGPGTGRHTLGIQQWGMDDKLALVVRHSEF